MRGPSALLLAAVLLTGCGGTSVEDAAPSGQRPPSVSLAEVAGVDADVLGVVSPDAGRSVVLLAPPGGPLTLADVAADGTATAVPLPGLDADRPGLTRIAAAGDGVVVVGFAAGRVALVAAGPQGAAAPQPVGTLGAADVAALDVTAAEGVLYLALSRIDGTDLLLAVDPATGAVRAEVGLPGTPRDLGTTEDDGVVVATDTGRTAVVVTADPGLAAVTETPLGPGAAGPLTVVDGEVYATVGGRGDLRITRGAEVLATVAGDLPAVLVVDPAGGEATLVDTVADSEVPRVLLRTVDLSAGDVVAEVELCDSGAVDGADVDGTGRGSVVSDCRGEPTLWRLP
ncbi:hypothetical protein SAMN05660657_02287 [Geodermatophilus amargosae]|uniref:DNA-binding beta-propeller fold protein YncE n=1 Tax=Geodermatophilus amargosae TaxID=1296565 RepID=A0A1I6ZW39_9ACTN|nr:hypothetical protein [Geodermatophilus amargosae]SFT66835.1 hypothetical protein SAMN05660657_02287 [Geodermatophilus amargosae]